MKFLLHVVRGREAPQRMVLEADGPVEANRQAAMLGWTVLTCESRGPELRKIKLGGQAQRAALVIFTEQAHALLQAGLSVIETLETLQRGGSNPSARLVGELITHLKQGQALSQAMARHPEFPPLLIAMVRSAEVTSNLTQALERFLEHERRAEEIRHQLTSVALYPLLLTTVGGLVMLFLLLYVMPRFSRVFEGMNNLPWSAQAMVAWSHLLKQHGSEILVAVAMAAVLLSSTLLLPVNRARLQANVLKIRPIERRLRIYFLARWYRTIGMLVEGGIPLPESLQLANFVLPVALQQSGSRVEGAMREGLAPSEAFIKAKMTTAVAEQLLRAGERSGDVGVMLTRSAEFHEMEVAKSLEKAMRIIEPVVMTIIGLGVGVVVILMYLPIFELASAIQ